jgi:hypothetical protein
MSTQKVKPDQGSLDRQQTQRRRSVGRKVGAFVVAAAIGLAACSGSGGTPRVEDATTAGPAEAPETTADDVATNFVIHYGAFNADQAVSYLADDADLSGLGLEGTREFRLLLSFLEAQGYKQMLTSCEETGSLASGSVVRCSFDFHLIRSDEIGRGPFTGSYLDLTVRDGEIVRASVYWEIEKFSPRMWEPFASWVSTTYPEDAAVMYTDGTYSNYRLTEESIRLWEKRSREYVKVEIAKKS